MKTILVVGGSSGIGKAIIEALKDTHKIINFSRNKIECNINTTHYSLDVLNGELPDLKLLDGIVYCPGSINLKPISRLKLNDFREDFEINVISAVRIIQKYINLLKENNGSVLLFSTVATKMGMPFHASVSASKSAVEGLAKSLAAEYATKVRFNVIAPTITNTPLASRLLRNDKQKEIMKERHPLKTYLEASEVASLALYLLSNQSKSISGQVFPIDGGLISLKL